MILLPLSQILLATLHLAIMRLLLKLSAGLDPLLVHIVLEMLGLCRFQLSASELIRHIRGIVGRRG